MMTIKQFLSRRDVKIFLRVALVLAVVVLLSGCGLKFDQVKESFYKVVFNRDPNGDAAAGQQAFKNCLFCSLFTGVWSAVQGVYSGIIRHLAPGALKLLAVFVGLALAVRTMKLVGSMNEPDLPGFWKDLVTLLFMAALCGAIIKDCNSTGTPWIVSEIAQPIFMAFIKFSMEVVSAIPSPGGSISCDGGSISGGFSCLIAAVQGKMDNGMASAVAMIKQADSAGTISTGVVIYLLCWMLLIIFPIMVIDGILGYGVTLALTPLWVFAFCFGQTRSFTKKALDNIFRSGMETAGLTIYTSIAASVFIDYMQNDGKALTDAAGISSNQEAMDKLANGSPSLMGYIFLCFFIFFFSQVISQIIGGIANGVSVGGTMGKAVTKAAALSGKAANKGLKLARGGIRLGANYANLKQAKSDKATIESLKGKKNLTKDEQKRLNQATNRMERNGYMRDGKETQAYKDLDKGGLRNNLRTLRNNWNMSASAQAAMRDDEKANPDATE